MTELERFRNRVAGDDGLECWLWIGQIDKNTGYGMFWMDGYKTTAHRAAHILLIGPIPPGYEVDHVEENGCRYRHCVNPAHLEAIPGPDHRRRTAARKTSCIHGHPYPDNAVLNCKGVRECRVCRAIRKREYRSRRRGTALVTIGDATPNAGTTTTGRNA